MIFVLQPGNDQALIPYGQKGSTRVPEADIRKVDGVTIRFRKDWIGTPGKWKWGFVDECVKVARQADRRYTLLLMSGEENPLSEGNLKFYEAAAKALGTRYGGDWHCFGVHVTGASPEGVSEELHWKPLTPAAEKANERMINAWGNAFPDKKLLLAIGNKDDSGMKRLIRYALARFKGLVVKHNSMKANTKLSANHNQLVIWAGTIGAGVGYEMVGSTKEARFGGTLNDAFDKIAEAQRGRVVDYVAVYPPDVRYV
jgi:hypothetical protein